MKKKMAGRKPGALVRVAEITGATKSLVKHCVAALHQQGGLRTPPVSGQQTWKPDLTDIAAVLATAKLSVEGFSTVHAAALITAAFDASATLAEVFPDEGLGEFAATYNDGLLQYFGANIHAKYGRKDFYSGISFREFLWSAAVAPEPFKKAGYAKIDREQMARRERVLATLYDQPVRSPELFPKCLLQYSARYATNPANMRATVLLEKPGYPWVLLGIGTSGNEIENTIRFAAPFESMTTLWPVQLMRAALVISEENPGT